MKKAFVGRLAAVEEKLTRIADARQQRERSAIHRRRFDELVAEIESMDPRFGASPSGYRPPTSSTPFHQMTMRDRIEKMFDDAQADIDARTKKRIDEACKTDKPSPELDEPPVLSSPDLVESQPVVSPPVFDLWPIGAKFGAGIPFPGG